MARISDATFSGASGRKYTFEVYHTGSEFEAEGAVYVVTRRSVRSGQGKHYFIYIGQTKDLSKCFTDHEKAKCFAQYGANCICFLVDNNERVRLALVADLRSANPDTPCND